MPGCSLISATTRAKRSVSIAGQVPRVVGGLDQLGPGIALADQYAEEVGAPQIVNEVPKGTEEVVDSVIEVLDSYRAADAMQVVFHLRRQDFAYQLRTNGSWSLKPDENCLLALQQHLAGKDLYFEYR